MLFSAGINTRLSFPETGKHDKSLFSVSVHENLAKGVAASGDRVGLFLGIFECNVSGSRGRTATVPGGGDR